MSGLITPDNHCGRTTLMEHHLVKRILASLLLAASAMSANAENVAPTVAITAPVDNATIEAPTAVTLTAEAADSDGTIAKVEFFSGATLLATVTQAPYVYVWNAVTPGSYAFTAKATDDLDLASTSVVKPVTVAAPAGAAKPFFIFSDQINTAREITDSAGAKVWQADPEPFGANLPNENPAGQGAFVYNPRFPGQYYDKETGLHYNYYRDYDPQTGRYIQSDPIGLGGGINTYGYVEGNPLAKVDPTGEIAFVPILIGIGVGMAFDYAVSEWKKKHCVCKDATTPAGPAGNGALGAANGVFGPYASKPRTGISGGGPAGSGTSVFSQANHAAAKSGAYSVATRNTLRDFGRSVSRKIPYVSGAIAAYEIYDAFNCD